MSLLDLFLKGTGDPQKDAAINRGLLTAGLSLMQARGRLFPALGQAGMAGLQAGDQTMQHAQQRQRAELHERAIRQQIEAQQRQAETDQLGMHFYRQPSAPAVDATGGMETAVEAPNNASGPGGFDMPGYIQALYARSPVQAMQLQQAMVPKEPEAWQKVEVDDGMGGKKIVVLDKQGRPIGEQLPGYVAPVQVNQGNQVSFVRPQAGTALPVGMSPSERDASARGWAGVNVQRERLAIDRTAAADGAKPPTGYRFKPDGSLEAIPGGPADIKAGELGAKTEARRALSVANASNVLETINEAKKMTGIFSAGLGGLAANVPMTDARELQGLLTTIKANIGFDRLQEMREASPTGGALGQVAVQELNSLQATIAALDQLKRPADLRRALEKVERHYTRWLETVQQAQGGQGGATGTWGAPSSGGRVVDWGSLR